MKGPDREVGAFHILGSSTVAIGLTALPELTCGCFQRLGMAETPFDVQRFGQVQARVEGVEPGDVSEQWRIDIGEGQAQPGLAGHSREPDGAVGDDTDGQDRQPVGVDLRAGTGRTWKRLEPLEVDTQATCRVEALAAVHGITV